MFLKKFGLGRFPSKMTKVEYTKTLFETFRTVVAERQQRQKATSRSEVFRLGLAHEVLSADANNGKKDIL